MDGMGLLLYFLISCITVITPVVSVEECVQCDCKVLKREQRDYFYLTCEVSKTAVRGDGGRCEYRKEDKIFKHDESIDVYMHCEIQCDFCKAMDCQLPGGSQSPNDYRSYQCGRQANYHRCKLPNAQQNKNIHVKTLTYGVIKLIISGQTELMNSDDSEDEEGVTIPVTATLGVLLLIAVHLGLVVIFVCRRKSHHRRNKRESIRVLLSREAASDGRAVNFCVASGDVQNVGDNDYDLVDAISDVTANSAATNGEYDKSHNFRNGNDESVANVYDHANFNTETSYDKFKVRSTPAKRDNDYDLVDDNNDVTENSAVTNGEYDKLHNLRNGNDESVANVYDHANFNTESSYDKFKVRTTPAKRNNDYDLVNVNSDVSENSTATGYE
ncbi:hypothetical protein ScPMuIL_011955 [Solemya velum]